VNAHDTFFATHPLPFGLVFHLDADFPNSARVDEAWGWMRRQGVPEIEIESWALVAGVYE